MVQKRVLIVASHYLRTRDYAKRRSKTKADHEGPTSFALILESGRVIAQELVLVVRRGRKLDRPSKLFIYTEQGWLVDDRVIRSVGETHIECRHPHA